MPAKNSVKQYKDNSFYHIYNRGVEKRIIFQGVYKAVLVNNEEQLLHLTRYIHLNPGKAGNNTWPSSLPEYLGRKKTSWVETSFILNYFNTNHSKNNYYSFINEGVEENQIKEMNQILI